MKRIILIMSLLASVLIVTQLLAWAKPLVPGLLLNEIGKVQLALTQSSEPARKTPDELIAAAITHPAPQYPLPAKAARVSGKVEVEVVIDQRGNVTDARALSGHPLLKDSAVASARQWKFDFVKFSETPTAVVGMLTFVFDLATEDGKDKFPGRQTADEAARWASSLRICREELGRSSPANEKLAMSMANLAASVRDANTVDDALRVFEEAERQKKLRSEARPYYAQLLLQKYNFESQQSVDQAAPSFLASRFLSPALQLFLQAYSDESGKDPIDGRKLGDIGWRISNLYELLGRQDEAIQWLQSMLNSSGLSDGARAGIAYYLAVHYWQKSYDLTSKYTISSQPLPDGDVPQVRQWVSEAYSYIQATHSLDPKYANAWFYEKLIALEESKIEPDPEKKRELQERAMQLQDRWMALITEQRKGESSSGSAYEKPYTSGLPSLNFLGLTILAAPPPPPPPPPPPASPSARPPSR
jgi:TonB family protein